MDLFTEIAQYKVSRETFKRIENFVSLLLEWNEKMNLVSKNAVKDIWLRHVLDSAQLAKYLSKENFALVDVGSGSGFPGMVLGIMMKEYSPESKITLVESIGKKVAYLQNVVERLELDNVDVCHNRAENCLLSSPDFITARAVASLDKIFSYTEKMATPKTSFLLLKGKTYKLELAEAEKNWKFNSEVYANQYSDDGVVLKITNLRKVK